MNMNGIGTRDWRLNTQKNSADLRLREDVNMDGIGIYLSGTGTLIDRLSLLTHQSSHHHSRALALMPPSTRMVWPFTYRPAPVQR